MSEYTYNIDKYTIGVDENGEDGIGMTVAKIENGELHFLGNYYGKNARCIDLLIKENQSLKKENKILRENAEHNDKVVDKVNWENQQLKEELGNYMEIIAKFKDLKSLIGILNDENLKYSFDEILKGIKKIIGDDK